MRWRETLAAVFGPGLFGGTSFGAWVRLLRANRLAVSPSSLPRFASATIGSIANSVMRQLENRKYGSEIERVEIRAPLFILGHWRSGTTHLHNLLARDHRLAFPNMYQVLNPETFLTTEAVISRLTSGLIPETRFGMDNVQLGWDVPFEDELATAATCFRSPYLAMAFPGRQEHYDRFLTFRNASEDDLQTWQRALTFFLKKLTWKYQRPLLLKSPPHTCRIRFLLEIFPDAKFVHVRRNPFAVYPSMRRMIAVALRVWGFQSHRHFDWEGRIVRQYREMHDVFFEERLLVPQGRFCEISFEELEREPIEQLRKIYEALDLGEFAPAERRVQEYLNSISGYKKNTFEEPDDAIRERLVRQWGRCFEEFGYATG